MKKRLTIAVVGVALAATVSFGIADNSHRDSVTSVDVLPGHQIVAIVRAMGLNPISEPSRRGLYYVLHAYDPSGIEVRVVADAQFGDVLSVAPALAINTAYAPRYERGPRIIHVPQADDDRTSIAPHDEPTATNENEVEELTPPPKSRRAKPEPRSEIAPKPLRRSDAPPPPPGPARAILSAPPPPAERTN